MVAKPWAEVGGRIEAHPAVDTAVLDELTLDVVVYDERNRQLRYLNQSAAATWLLCDGSTDAMGIARELTEIFGLDPAVAGESVTEALDAFWSAGLLLGTDTTTAESALGAGSPGVRVLPREPDP